MSRDIKGFTVVELLIVIMTIIALAAILIPKITNIVDKRKAFTLEHEVEMIGQGLLEFHRDCGTFPKAVGVLWNKNWATAGNVLSGEDCTACWQGPYVATLPPNQLGYFYSPFGTSSTCTLKTDDGDINGNGNQLDLAVVCLNIPKNIVTILKRRIDGDNMDLNTGNLLAQCNGDLCTVTFIVGEL